MRVWADRTGAQRIIVPTEIFSTRRTRWMLHRAFDGTAVSITVPALDPAAYDRDNWWRSERGIIAFQNELLKYLYYRLRY